MPYVSNQSQKRKQPRCYVCLKNATNRSETLNFTVYDMTPKQLQKLIERAVALEDSSYQTATASEHGSDVSVPTNHNTGANAPVGHSAEASSSIDGVSKPNTDGAPTGRSSVGTNTTTELAQGSPAGSVPNPPEGISDSETVTGPCNQPGTPGTVRKPDHIDNACPTAGGGPQAPGTQTTASSKRVPRHRNQTTRKGSKQSVVASNH